MIPARFTQTGRDWSTSYHARANTERRTDRMALSRSDRRDIWLGFPIGLVVALLFFIAAGVRWS